jgi:hypothetical protein
MHIEFTSHSFVKIGFFHAVNLVTYYEKISRQGTATVLLPKTLLAFSLRNF